MKKTSGLICFLLLLISGCIYPNAGPKSSPPPISSTAAATTASPSLLPPLVASTSTNIPTLPAISTPSATSTPPFLPQLATPTPPSPITPSNASDLEAIFEITQAEKTEDFYWSSDGRYLDAISSYKFYLYRIQIPLFGRSQQIKLPSFGSFLGPLPGNPDLFAYESLNEIKFWNLQKDEVVYHYGWPRVYFQMLAFDPGGGRFARAGIQYDEDGGGPVVEVVDIASGKVLLSLTGHSNDICSLSFSPDGAFLASGACGRDSSQNIVLIWNTITGKLVTKLPETFVNWANIRFMNASNRLVVFIDGFGLKLWDVQANRWIRKWKDHLWIWPVKFNPNDTLMVGPSDDGSLCVWDVNNAAIIKTLVPPSRDISKFSFSPDGKYLAILYDSGKIVIWAVGSSTMLP